MTKLIGYAGAVIADGLAINNYGTIGCATGGLVDSGCRRYSRCQGEIPLQGSGQIVKRNRKSKGRIGTGESRINPVKWILNSGFGRKIFHIGSPIVAIRLNRAISIYYSRKTTISHYPVYGIGLGRRGEIFLQIGIIASGDIYKTGGGSFSIYS